MATSINIIGDKEIDRMFRLLATSGSRKEISRAVLGAMMTEVSRGIRNAIPPKRRSIKKTIGRSYKKNKQTGKYEAKVGLGVGKRTKSKKQRPQKPGVGISKANVHWFILGTKFRRRKSGAPTGVMLPAPDWVKQGYEASRHQAIKSGLEAGRKKTDQLARSKHVALADKFRAEKAKSVSATKPLTFFME